MKQNPVRPAAGLVPIADLPRAHIQRDHRIVIQIRREHELPVRRYGDIADKIAQPWLRVRDFELARRLQLPIA